MTAVASETYTSTSAPIQCAAVVAFEVGPEIQRYLAGARRILRAIGERVHEELESIGAAVAVPRGAFYVFPDFGPLRERLARRGITTSVSLCEQLLTETGVALLPGQVFGRPPSELTARLAYVDFDGAAALVAENSVAKDEPLDAAFLEARAPRVIEALTEIRGFMERA
jgi:aspartate aminotransferase